MRDRCVRDRSDGSSLLLTLADNSDSGGEDEAIDALDLADGITAGDHVQFRGNGAV